MEGPLGRETLVSWSPVTGLAACPSKIHLSISLQAMSKESLPKVPTTPGPLWRPRPRFRQTTTITTKKCRNSLEYAAGGGDPTRC